MRKSIVAAILALFAGCAFNTSMTRTRNEPIGGPTTYVEVLNRTPNADAFTDFAKIEAQGNNWQSAADCTAKLLVDARQWGADAILMQPEESGLGKGPKCSGIAYHSKKAHLK